ncbi:hypothetical protein [Leptospirillum ferriphilum]|nr:hypothetical protein [Leptospirillum ferriphilum]
MKAWNARLKEGRMAEEIIAGVSRYRMWCEKTGKINTEMVKQAATFFGPDMPFLEAWDVSPLGRNGPETPKRMTFGEMRDERNSQAMREFLGETEDMKDPFFAEEWNGETINL